MEQSFVGGMKTSNNTADGVGQREEKKRTRKINVWKLAFCQLSKTIHQAHGEREEPEILQRSQAPTISNSAPHTHLLLKSNLSSFLAILRYSTIFLLRFRRPRVNRSSRWATKASPVSRVLMISSVNLSSPQTLNVLQPSQHPISATKGGWEESVRETWVRYMSCESTDFSFAYYWFPSLVSNVSNLFFFDRARHALCQLESLTSCLRFAYMCTTTQTHLEHT